MDWSVEPAGTPGTELPPDYAQVRAPTQPLTYTFSPHMFGAMLLLPPANAPDTRPLYHISFAPDVFNPSASTTAVRRGGSAENALVGEFDWGASKAVHAVRINEVQYEASTVLHEWRDPQSQGRGPCRGWTWKWRNEQFHHLFWRVDKFTSHVVLCYHVPGGVLSRDHILGNAAPVAVFTGRPLRTREDHRPHPLPTLKIFPGAHTGMLLDHIVLTALLIERWRLAPEL